MTAENRKLDETRCNEAVPLICKFPFNILIVAWTLVRAVPIIGVMIWQKCGHDPNTVR